MPDDARIRSCLARMRRRGPDAAGIYRHRYAAGREVCLLHARLSILDLDSRSDQPMHRDGRVLVHNGEIYNYLELRRRASRHQPLHTSSDTEVLLGLLAEEGVAALDACEGMWAFACYDESDGSLLLSRDRFAEKPLYVYRAPEGLYFGSEIKFIAALTVDILEPDTEQVVRYLINGYRSLHRRGRSFFRNVTEFPAGSYLRVRRRRYRSPPAVLAAGACDRTIAELRGSRCAHARCLEKVRESTAARGCADRILFERRD